VEEEKQGIYDPQSYPQYEEDIEPTETDFDDGADLDEGTVVGSKPYPQKPAHYYARKPEPKVQQSPRMKVARSVEKPLETKQFKEDKNDWRGISDIEEGEPEPGSDEWKTIQKKIDVEYEKKLKEVSDDAMKKLKSY